MWGSGVDVPARPRGPSIPGPLPTCFSPRLPSPLSLPASGTLFLTVTVAASALPGQPSSFSGGGGRSALRAASRAGAGRPVLPEISARFPRARAQALPLHRERLGRRSQGATEPQPKTQGPREVPHGAPGTWGHPHSTPAASGRTGCREDTRLADPRPPWRRPAPAEWPQQTRRRSVPGTARTGSCDARGTASREQVCLLQRRAASPSLSAAGGHGRQWARLVPSLGLSGRPWAQCVRQPASQRTLLRWPVASAVPPLAVEGVGGGHVRLPSPFPRGSSSAAGPGRSPERGRAPMSKTPPPRSAPGDCLSRGARSFPGPAGPRLHPARVAQGSQGPATFAFFGCHQGPAAGVHPGPAVMGARSCGARVPSRQLPDRRAAGGQGAWQEGGQRLRLRTAGAAWPGGC